MSDPALMPATELLSRFRAKDLSPVEVTEAALKRIDRHDGELNAYCLVAPDSALQAAEASAERYASGDTQGLLDGVPVGVKDVFLTKDWPTLKGSCLVDPDQPWDDDAPVVASLRAHNAVILGKTTTPELGWKGVTDSPVTGVTRNPWDPERTPGGSSGGSSAAVVAGMGTLALGTDGGGSIRIPAGFSGHAGIKPTYGRVPVWPPSPYGTLAHAGPMARTVADCALMLDALAGPDPRDWTVLPPDGVDHLAALEGGIEGSRVAFSPDLGYVDVDPEIASSVAAAASAFEDLGAKVERVDPGFTDPVEMFCVLWFSGAAQSTKDASDAQFARVDPGLREVIEQGRTYTAVDYVDAVAERAKLAVRMNVFFETYDLLLTPTLPIAAFEAGREVPEGWPHQRWMSWARFSYPFNLTQHPAASVPCGLTSAGLPVGLQIVGPRFADADLLRAAHTYETTHPLEARPAMLD